MKRVTGWHLTHALRWMNTKWLAFFFLSLVVVVLRIGGFPKLYGLVKKWPVFGTPGHRSETDIILTLCSALDSSLRFFVSPAYCLVQASVLVCLMRIHGIEAQMVIGVNRFPFAAHAWAEANGRVIKSDPENWPYPFKVIDRF